MAMELEMGGNTITMISPYCGLFAAVKAALAQPYLKNKERQPQK